jgi:sulfur relay (sulfurtransferase) DsrC/TusE family protein
LESQSQRRERSTEVRSRLERGVVPTVYETFVANSLELEDLERLFPDGYQRDAVKLAGLRVL